ncbi:MAG: alpha/beta hydrolase [Candidatus Krumholzibacteriia bacterium]
MTALKPPTSRATFPFALALAAVLAFGAVPSITAAPAGAQPAASAGAAEAPAPIPREGRGENEIVLIHGLGSSAAVWDEIKPYLLGTFTVWTYELHGHGRSQPMADPTIAREAAALERFLRENDIVHPVLVGHAMGGMIAMEYAFAHPADVRRLVVIDAAPVQLATAEQKAQVARALMEDYDRFVASRYLGYSPAPEVAERILDDALRTHQQSFVSLLMSSFDYDLADEIESNPVPILVVGSEMLFSGGSDPRLLLHQMGYDRAQNIAFQAVDRTGHYIMLERPVALAGLIVAFSRTERY